MMQNKILSLFIVAEEMVHHFYFLNRLLVNYEDLN